MSKNDIHEKERVIQEIKSQFDACNDGHCYITRQGKQHFFHFEKEQKSHVLFAASLLISSELFLAVITIITNHTNPINGMTVFIAAIPFGIFTIWYAKYLHDKQKKYSEFLQFKESMNSFFDKGDLNKSIQNGKAALEIEPTNIGILNVVGVSYFKLEKFSDALIYFGRILDLV